MSVATARLEPHETEFWNATHFNSNRAVALYIRTNGLNPDIHEIVQICVFPLNSKFQLSRDITPFCCNITPIHPLHTELGGELSATTSLYENSLVRGLRPQEAAELFDLWMEKKIKPAFRKKLMPLTYNWPAIKPFLKKWLGPLNFDGYFSKEYRDLIPVALFANDYADMHIHKTPYDKTILSFICNLLQVEYNRSDDIMLITKAISECYVEMQRRIIPVVS